MMKSLPILIVIGLFVLPSGRALQCYQCSSDLKGDCAEPKDEKLQECSTTTSTSTETTPASSGTSPGTSTETTPASPSTSTTTTTTTKPDSSSTSTTSTTTTKPASPSPSPGTPDKPPAVPNARVSSVIVERLSSKQVYADDQPKTVCVKIITNTTVTRDCALNTACTGDNCYACDTDGCNSATSVAVYTSAMFGLLAVVFMTR